MKRYLIAVITLAICFPISLNAMGNRATVLYVIDGDTIKVMYEGKKESIRLIGIDAPESKKNKKAFKDSARSSRDINTIIGQGKLAKKYVKGLVKKGDEVRIDFDVEKRDRYHRLLGYVYLPDGRMLNDLIIRNGYASPLTIAPNVRYRGRFSKSFKYAREHRLGLWK
jgi:micrococcal nuclease